jgi:hypothetical protein
MRERGDFPATILEQRRRPCRPRHPYAVPRTSLQCVYTRRRNCIAQLSPSQEYALRTVDFPALPQSNCTTPVAAVPDEEQPSQTRPQRTQSEQMSSGLAEKLGRGSPFNSRECQIIGTIRPLRADRPRAVRGPRNDSRPCFFLGEPCGGAMAALLHVAEHDGPSMFTPTGAMRAVNPRVERVFDPSRKDERRRRRKLTRDQ